MPINLVDHRESFITNVLPVARKMGLGVIAMKSNAMGAILRKNVARIEEWSRFTWPRISHAVSGVETVDQLANVLTVNPAQAHAYRSDHPFDRTRRPHGHGRERYKKGTPPPATVRGLSEARQSFFLSEKVLQLLYRFAGALLLTLGPRGARSGRRGGPNTQVLKVQTVLASCLDLTRWQHFELLHRHIPGKARSQLLSGRPVADQLEGCHPLLAGLQDKVSAGRPRFHDAHPGDASIVRARAAPVVFCRDHDDLELFAV